MSGGGGGILNYIIHGIIRTTPIVGQTYAKGSASAPILIGPKGGIIVEGINSSVPATGVSVTDFVVNNVSQTILAADPNRTSNIFQNNGANDIWLGFDAPAVAGVGFRVYANTTWEAPIVFQGTVDAITAAGTSNTAVMES